MSARSILVVEDEPILAMALEDMLIDLGQLVVGPASRFDEAMALARSERIDAAILDLNLNGIYSHDIADVLEARGVPVLFATGYGAAISERHAHLPVLPKPYRLTDLKEALFRLIG